MRRQTNKKEKKNTEDEQEIRKRKRMKNKKKKRIENLRTKSRNDQISSKSENLIKYFLLFSKRHEIRENYNGAKKNTSRFDII